jgi:hypothetical protein
MNESKTATAHFLGGDTYSLTLNASPTEGGSVSGGGNYGKDAVVEVTATASDNYDFIEWTGDTEYLDDASLSTTSVTMPEEAVNLTANFQLKEYLTTVNIVGSGTVTKNPSADNYVYGTEVVLTATPEENWSFSHWSGDASGLENPKTVVIDGEKTITANFTEDNLTIVIGTEGEGSVSKVPEKAFYAISDEVELTAVPEAGWSFSHWSGDISGSENPKTVTMNESKTVNAIFEREAVVVEEYNLSISVSGSGTVVKNPDGESYRNGTEVELTASDSSGWRFSGWSGDASGSENPINVTMNDDKDITVTFSKISSGGGGGGSRIPRDDDDDEDDDEEDDDEEEDEEGEKLELENELVSFDDDSFEEYKEQAEEKQKEVEALESSHNRLENIKKNAESIINFLEESGNNETAEAVSEIISKAEQLQEKIKEQLQEKEQELEEVEKKKEKVENFKRAERISETASLLLENIENEEIRRVLEEVIAKTEEIKQKIQSN